MSAKVMTSAARARARMLELKKEIARLQAMAAQALAADLAGDDEPGVVLEGRVVGGKIIIDKPDGRYRGGR